LEAGIGIGWFQGPEVMFLAAARKKEETNRAGGFIPPTPPRPTTKKTACQHQPQSQRKAAQAGDGCSREKRFQALFLRCWIRLDDFVWLI